MLRRHIIFRHLEMRLPVPLSRYGRKLEGASLFRRRCQPEESRDYSMAEAPIAGDLNKPIIIWLCLAVDGCAKIISRIHYAYRIRRCRSRPSSALIAGDAPLAASIDDKLTHDRRLIHIDDNIITLICINVLMADERAIKHFVSAMMIRQQRCRVTMKFH